MKFKTTIVGVLLAAAIALAGCGSDQCIVLANGGNKLCGEDAAAWCDSTDAVRDTTGFGQYISEQDKQAISDSQQTCDDIRAGS